MKAKELKQILSQFDDDDEVAVRLFGGGLFTEITTARLPSSRQNILHLQTFNALWCAWQRIL